MAGLPSFSASVDVDGRLWPQDIEGSKAHVRMLSERGILSKADADLIVSGLDRIGAAISAEEFDWDASKEDVHMNIEAALTEAIGDAATQRRALDVVRRTLAPEVEFSAEDASRSDPSFLVEILTAVHEAGHCVVGLVTGEDPTKASIVVASTQAKPNSLSVEMVPSGSNSRSVPSASMIRVQRQAPPTCSRL